MNKYDVVIIGGGINGCGIAADASLRQLKVLLCEKNDIASGTSSASTKLIHGGLRYLENYHFRLVKKALDERQILQQVAPNLIKPLKFILPLNKNSRNRWLIRLGLFLYDHLSWKNTLPKTSFHTKGNGSLFEQLKNELSQAYSFYDCITDDSRLTISNAIQAKQAGADIMTRTTVIGVNYFDEHAIVTLKDEQGMQFEVFTKSIINAAGPWVNTVDNMLAINSPYDISLVQGSHIVVPKLYKGDHAYLLQNDDGRVFFTIPYHGHTLVGTTENNYDERPELVEITSEEINYLLNSVNNYFTQSITSKEVIHSWSGVRPLLKDKNIKLKSISRDYKIHVSDKNIAVISVYGGKITTYRQLANQTVNALSPSFENLAASVTDKILLPNNKLFNGTFAAYKIYSEKKYHWLPNQLLQRYLTHYGVLTEMILKNCHQLSNLGENFNHGLYAQEIDYLIEHEWALTLDDILWRRTKLAYKFSQLECEKLQKYLNNTHNLNKLTKNHSTPLNY